ncbi:hypothetical protein D3C73_765680 [compost metagenome]
MEGCFAFGFILRQRDIDLQRHRLVRRGLDGEFASGHVRNADDLHRRLRHAVKRQHDRARFGDHVEEANGVAIADGTIRLHDELRIAVMQHVDFQPVAGQERNDKADADRSPDAHIEQRARAKQDFPVEMADAFNKTTIRLAGSGGIDRRGTTGRRQRHVGIVFVERRISDQAAFLADLVHHAIAGVDTERTGDTGHLLAVANIDAHGTDCDAGVAIDAVADDLAARCRLLGVAAARFAAPVVIGHDQRMLVEHGALNTRPGTHVDTDLFAHQATEQVGGGGQDGDGGIGNEGGLTGDEIEGKRWRVGEIEDPGAACSDCDGNPDRMLDDTLGDLVRCPGAGIEFHPRIAIAFNEAFDDEKEIDPDRLRTGISAPGATDGRGQQEKAKARHDQKTGDEDKFLRPDFDEEEIEAPTGEIDKHGLIGCEGATIPPDPRRQIIDAERDKHHQPLEPAETSLGTLGEDLLAFFIKRLAFFARRMHRLDINPFDRCVTCGNAFGGIEIHRNIPLHHAFSHRATLNSLTQVKACSIRRPVHAPRPCGRQNGDYNDANARTHHSHDDRQAMA